MTSLSATLAALVLALSAVSASAQILSNGDGTAGVAPLSGTAAVLNVGRVRPSITAQNSALHAAGVGLRNRGHGAILLSGIPASAEVRRAFVYWNVLSNGPPPPAAARLSLQRLSPARRPPVQLRGQVVGRGSSPCWGSTDTNTVYRARVDADVVTGNGTYGLGLPARTYSVTDGSSPWGNGGSLMINGASMLVVTTGQNVVMIYDRPMAGRTFTGNPGIRLRLATPRAAWRGGDARLHVVASDGQSGSPHLADTLALMGETTLVNRNVVAGPGSITGAGSDLNGADGGRSAQLWDTALHDISPFIRQGQQFIELGFVTDVPSATGTDCVVPVAVGLERSRNSAAAAN